MMLLCWHLRAIEVVALDLNPKSGTVRSAANPVMLPKPEPRAMREQVVVLRFAAARSLAFSRLISGASNISSRCFDVVDSAFNIHPVLISNRSAAIVNRSGTCTSGLA
jgi:hypothetical protein